MNINVRENLKQQQQQELKKLLDITNQAIRGSSTNKTERK